MQNVNFDKVVLIVQTNKFEDHHQRTFKNPATDLTIHRQIGIKAYKTQLTGNCHFSHTYPNTNKISKHYSSSKHSQTDFQFSNFSFNLFSCLSLLVGSYF